MDGSYYIHQDNKHCNSNKAIEESLHWLIKLSTVVHYNPLENEGDNRKMQKVVVNERNVF